MREIQFIRSPAQGNIYSTTRVGFMTLIGSGNYGKILAHVNPRALEEVPLTSIPVGSDIIAVDACQDAFHIIGVTFVQKTVVGIEEVKMAYLNFYSTWTTSENQEPFSQPVKTIPSTSENQEESLSKIRKGSTASHKNVPIEDLNFRQLEAIGQKCVQFKLNFIPYHLYHCPVLKPTGIYENVFLLSGSDCRIHVYEPNEEGKTFCQVPTANYFPELDGTFSSVITRIQIEYLQDIKKRVTIVGCEDGQLKSFVVSESELLNTSMVSLNSSKDLQDDEAVATENDGQSAEQLKNEASGGESCGGDSLVSSMNEDLEFGKAVIKSTNFFDGMITSIQIYTDGNNVNAVVASSNTPVFLFTDIIDNGFKKGACLKFSSRWDCVQSVCVTDIDFDGQAEIVIGTSGCTLLVYKYMGIGEQLLQWVIVAHRKFPSTIYSVEFFNYHLYVVTASGLHIIESCEAYFHKHGIEMTPERVRQYAEDSRNMEDGDIFGNEVE